MTDAHLSQAEFRAMGTLCRVAVTAGPGDAATADAALAAAHAEVAACERALSRFDPCSELSCLNDAAGTWMPVAERLATALGIALDAREKTGGRFDPTILPALAAAGYDRSFELLNDRPSGHAPAWRAGAAIELDPNGGRARIAKGSAVDLGGIGKGFAAMRSHDAMRVAWPELRGALVDLGGDIAVWGLPPKRGPWLLSVADPRSPDAVLCTLALENGGVATSGRDARRFGPGGSLHHLIDPATGRPAKDGPLAVTVVGPDSVQAEAHATALALCDQSTAGVYVDARPALSALAVFDDGDPVVLGPLPLVERHRLAALA